MPVTLSEIDLWKNRIIKIENPLETYLKPLFDQDGNDTDRSLHEYKVFVLVWNLSIENEEIGARQSDIVEAMVEWCANRCKLDEHGTSELPPETWKNTGTVRTKTKQVLKRFVNAGVIVRSDDKNGEKNPTRVFYKPHIETYIRSSEIPPEFRLAAISRLQSDNLDLEMALFNTRHFLHNEGLWEKFVQSYEKKRRRPFPEFRRDSLGSTRVKSAEL